MVTIRSLLVGGLLLASQPALAAPLTNAAAVEQALRAAGYTQIHDLERDDGLWEADVSRADGVFAEIYVDPANGEIFDAHDGRPLLDSAAILQRAAAHGLKDVRKLERDGATWKLEARDARNHAVEVRLSGVDGRVLHSQREYWWD